MAEKKKSLETAFDELQDIINKLEAPDCTLEHSFQLYTEGMKLIKLCNDSIDKVEKEVILLEEA